MFERDGAVVIAVNRELDLSAVTDFREARHDALRRELNAVVDLTDCEFIDSTGIACVLRTFQRLERMGRRFALVGTNLQVRRVLELVGIPERVPVFDSLDEALTQLGDGGSRPSPA